jgi:hypothetical protein
MNDYAEKWKEYRRLRRNYYLGLFVTLFLGGMLVALADRLTRGYFFNGPIRGILIVLSPLLAYPLKQKVVSWPCPKCGHDFGGGSPLRFPWIVLPRLRAKCVHCGLSLNDKIVRGEAMISS